MEPDQLIEKTRERLNSHRGRILQIAESAGVSYSWATKFAQGNVDNPTIRQLAALIDAIDRDEAA
jgi:transcriptional regulator with XRE-family HTH domain